MNTIGKILVILNFIFAIAVGVFLIFDFALRTKWEAAYHAIKREADVMDASRKTTAKVTESVLNENRQFQTRLDESKQKLKDTEDEMSAKLSAKEIELSVLNNKIKDSDLSLQEALKSKQRLTDEIAVLSQTIKDRETLVVKLEADVKAIKIIAINNESTARTGQTRNEELLEQVRTLTTALARKDAGLNTDTIVTRNPNAPNPPTVKVKGKIERVDAIDGTLVEISLGTDHGVNKNHTLDVYRIGPESKYLGMIRVVEAFHHKSVGRLVTTGNAALRPQLKQGDQVGSMIH